MNILLVNKYLKQNISFFSLFLQWNFLIYYFELLYLVYLKLRKLPGCCTNIMRFFPKGKGVFSFQGILHSINNEPIRQFFSLSKGKRKLGREVCRLQDPAGVRQNNLVPC